MDAPKVFVRVSGAIVVLTAFCLGLTAYGQQCTTPASPEQEFFDAIKKGTTAKVGELLKQIPALIKARTKKGTTPVLLAMFNRHKEIAELLATGIETNIFEATELGRIERVRE